VNERGELITGDTLLVLLNGHTDTVPFALPPVDPDQQWQRVFDTFDPHGIDKMIAVDATYALQGRSVAVFKMITPSLARRRLSDSRSVSKPEPAGVES
jgi:glycogen operon protein